MKHFYSSQHFLQSQMDYEDKGRTLVIGSRVYGNAEDARKLYRWALGLDMIPGEGVDIVHDLEEPLGEEHGVFDHLHCCSVFEHVQRPWLMAQNMESILNPGGTILFRAPFVWRVHNYPGDYWRYTAQALEILFPSVTWIERGYLMNDVYRQVTNKNVEEGKKFLERSELIGFGIKKRNENALCEL